MPVDDNAFLLLRTAARPDRVPARQLHRVEEPVLARDLRHATASCTIDGLGGSYGVERLAFYRMLPEMGPPETTIWEYPRGDRSWALEFEEFLDDIRLGREPSAGLADARAALSVVDEIHRRPATRRSARSVRLQADRDARSG